MLKAVSIALFVAVSAMHLFACYFRYTLLRRITKPMLMPLLLICYVASENSVSLLIVAALLLGTLGDVLLLSMSLKCFTLGAVSFAVGHVMYIWHMAGRLAAHPYTSWQTLLCVTTALLFYIAWTVTVSAVLRQKMPVHMRNILPVYMLLIGAMSACAVSFVVLPVTNGAAAPLPAILAAVGSIMFVVSDSILAFETFGDRLKRTRHSNFFVMITYITAQALLVWGLAGL